VQLCTSNFTERDTPSYQAFTLYRQISFVLSDIDLWRRYGRRQSASRRWRYEGRSKGS